MEQMKSQATYTSQYSSTMQPQGVFQHATVGAVTETANNEYRVAMTPASAREFILNGHAVYVQSGFATRAGFSDEEYKQMGATVVPTAEDVFKKCSIVIKVNPPQQQECNYIQPQQVIFCLTDMICEKSQAELVKAMVDRRATLVSYNWLSSSPGSFPVFDCLNELAGFLAVQQVMKMMEVGGIGTCFGQLSGQPGANVLIIGATTSGCRAASFAAATGAQVTVMDTCTEALRNLSERFPNVQTMQYTTQNLEKALPFTNTLIGCVIPMAGKAPMLVSEQQLKMMMPGSIAIDLAAKMGGNFQCTTPHTIQKPSYVWNGITMYTATDITCLAPRSASLAISQSALPFALQVANKGWKKAVIEWGGLQAAVFMADAHLTSRVLATSLKMNFTPIEQVIEREIQQVSSTQQQASGNLISLKQQLNTFRSQYGQSTFTIEA